MSKRKKVKRQAASPSGQRSLPAEDRRAEATTVAWTLSGLATLAADVGSLALRWLVRDAGETPLAALPSVLLLVAAVSGMVAVALTPLVYRFRKSPPPKEITAMILLGAAAPWLLWAIQAWRP